MGSHIIVWQRLLAGAPQTRKRLVKTNTVPTSLLLGVGRVAWIPVGDAPRLNLWLK